jgi:DnaJ-class molecular chaperone
MRTREFKDYYQILNVEENASEAEIKKVFRKLAMENHPDHNPDDPQSENRFKEISEAYGVLINPVKRREYNLFRNAHYSGAGTGESEFRYSQQDIFEGMFREDAARKIFEELNREFRRQGFRSGNTFFEGIFFGGAVGGLSRILGMIPGPLGKIGVGLRLAHMVGSSLMAYSRMKQAKDRAEGKPVSKIDPLGPIKEVFSPSAPAAESKTTDLNYSITVPPAEALAGGQKKFSYQVGKETEQLLVRIPANIQSGAKLRIKGKGLWHEGKRGDLILTVNIDSPGT